MIQVYARREGVLALKAERIQIAKSHGVTILEFGEEMPIGGILLADSRPKDFKGCRGPDDLAATAIHFNGQLHNFENFDRALSKALKLAALRNQ